MTLFDLMQPHAPMKVWAMGPGNLKQLITQWFQKHPAFFGLPPSAWCKRLKEADPDSPPGHEVNRHIFKFCFECTPFGPG